MPVFIQPGQNCIVRRLNLDMYKVLKMITLHELEECLMPDFTVRSNITLEEKIELGKQKVHEAADGLMKADEIENLLDEFNAHQTNESKFCYLVDKIECDMQAKVYDLEGHFLVEKAREDLPYFGARAKEIEKSAKCASDYWILFDEPKFKNSEIFSSLIDEIMKIKELK